jgi:hypothetical protein
LRIAGREVAEHLADLFPVAHFEHAAAGVRVQSDDARTDRGDQPVELVEFEQRDTELRVHAGGPDVVVMAAPEARVHAHQHVAAAEQGAPLAQRVEIVDRQVHAVLDGPLVFAARSEVRCEQQLAGVDAGHDFQDMLAFALRDALEREPEPGEGAQDLRVRIGLDRVEEALDAADAEQLLRRQFKRCTIVDVGAAVLVRDTLEFHATFLPPGRPARGNHRSKAVDLLPGRSEHVIRRRVPDDHIVQPPHEPVALLFVHDESDVQVVRRLRDEIDALLLEQLERIAEAVQRRANAAADQAHGRAGSDHFDPADPR